jgi:hypothetical protein
MSPAAIVETGKDIAQDMSPAALEQTEMDTTQGSLSVVQPSTQPESPQAQPEPALELPVTSGGPRAAGPVQAMKSPEILRPQQAQRPGEHLL